MAVRAVLFDLDGTLLGVHTGQLIGAYVRLLAEWFAPQVSPERFVVSLLSATDRMMENRDTTRTNKEVFDEAFYPTVGLTEAEAAPHLAAFYDRAFPTLRSLTSEIPAAREAVSVALDHGAAAVLATQPIFPVVAIRERMAWAGVADLPFTLITSYESMHSCKPHPEYFQEAAAAVNCTTGDCLFVGNDGIEDAAARQVGMQSYLITDYLTNGPKRSSEVARMGALRDLPDFLSSVL